MYTRDPFPDVERRGFIHAGFSIIHLLFSDCN
jgi:hypothetical protein